MSTDPNSPTPQENQTPPAPESTQTNSTPPTPGATPPQPENPKEQSKTEGEKPSEQKTEGAPEPLTVEAITLPEGMEVDQEKLNAFVELMNDDKMSGTERAQKLVDLQTDLMKQVSERGNELWQQTQDKWQEEVLAMPEYKGEKWDQASARISKLLDSHGTPELREVFDFTGAGNHPEVVKFLDKVASAFGEGLPTVGGPTSTAQDSAAKRLFPSMK